MLLNNKLTTKEQLKCKWCCWIINWQPKSSLFCRVLPQHVAAVDELVIFILLSDTRAKQNIVKQCQQNTILQKRKSFETLNAAWSAK